MGPGPWNLLGKDAGVRQRKWKERRAKQMKVKSESEVSHCWDGDGRPLVTVNLT